MKTPRKSLRTLASEARGYLETVWHEWHRERGEVTSATPSAGTCGRSSEFLVRFLRSRGIQAEFRTGSPDDRCGFFVDGAWHGHSWVEAVGWIVDITADQYGLGAVTVAPADDPRYRAGPDRAWPEYRRRREETADVAWIRFLNSSSSSVE